MTELIGFGILQQEKTMGLAPYGRNVQKQLFDFKGRYDGIATDYGEVCIEDSYELRNAPCLQTFEDRARAAFEVQAECERAMLYLAEYAKKRTGARYLCISGGVALNSVANYKVLRSGLFEDIFINPAASDTGIPLGAALYGLHKLAHRPKTYKQISPYLGPAYAREAVWKAIDAYKGTTYDETRYEGFHLVTENAEECAVEMLANNRIVACWYGRSEMGPRALGNRSILMSPLRAENKDILNARVKHREAFRPFAPSCLGEHAADYFDIDRPSPYMCCWYLGLNLTSNVLSRR